MYIMRQTQRSASPPLTPRYPAVMLLCLLWPLTALLKGLPWPRNYSEVKGQGGGGGEGIPGSAWEGGGEDFQTGIPIIGKV